MKILIDARLYGLENTGIGRYLINLIDGLHKVNSGHKFVLLLKRKYFDQLNLGKNWKKVLADIAQYTFAEQIKLPKLIRSENPDLVHFPHINVPIFWQGNFVVTIHDMSMHKQGIDATKLPVPIYLFKRLPYKLAFRVAVKKSSKIITPSDVIKNEIMGYFNVNDNNISTIYEGVDEVYFKTPSRDLRKKYSLPEKYLLHVGNVYPHKNIEAAIDALAVINQKEEEKLTLAISCSRNEFTKGLEKTIQRKKAKNYVKLLGFVPDNDLKSLHKYSVSYIYPSFSEGFGLQGLEAMAAGGVVLASNIPIFKEIYRDYAIYFNPGNISSIVSAISFVLYMDLADRELLIEKSKVLVKNYSWKKMSEDTLRVYESAVDKKI